MLRLLVLLLLKLHQRSVLGSGGQMAPRGGRDRKNVARRRSAQHAAKRLAKVPAAVLHDANEF